MSTARRYLSLSVLVGAVLLLTIDSTVLFLAVPALAADLGANATQVLWIGDIYSLVIAGFLVTMGNVADRIGRKKLLLIGSTLFGLASVAAAFAVTPEMLIAARFALGIAGATLMPSTLSLIRTVFTDPTERTRAIAIWSAAASGGVALGPVLGGFLLEHFWWGSVFLINVPVMIVIVVLGAWVLPESKNGSSKRLDLASSLLSMLAIVPFVYAVKQFASGAFGAEAFIALMLSAAGIYFFVRRQRRLDEPMLDVSLFTSGPFTGAISINFISVFALSGVLFFFSQYLQLARGLSALEAGFAQLPVAIASMLAIAFVGFLLGRLGRGRAIALALSIASLSLMMVAMVEGSEHLIWVVLAIVPLGLGLGISETLSIDAVVSSVPEDKAGAASAISETAYELGAAMGIAVLGSAVMVIYRFALPAGMPAEAHESLATAAQAFAPDSEIFHAAREAFVTAMQSTTFIAAVIMMFAAFVALKLIPNSKATVDAHGSDEVDSSAPAAVTEA